MSNHVDGIEILALNRQFNLGTLYNYVDDIIIPNIRLWDPNDVSDIAVDEMKENVDVFLKKIEQPDERNEDYYVGEEQTPFLSNLGMDDHTAMSLMAGLIRPSLKGAWQYAADWVDSNNELLSRGAHVAVHCCRSKKTISIDPESGLDIVCRSEKLRQIQATHVVIGITYGLEAFCIFPQDQEKAQKKDRKNDEMMKETTMNYARFFKDRLVDEGENLEASEDEEGDEEDGCLRCIPKDFQCILYSDLSDSKDGKRTPRPVAEQYKACSKVLGHGTGKPIPLRVRLYPLNKLMAVEERVAKMPRNVKDVSQELLFRCQAILSHFHGICFEAELLANELDGLIIEQSIPSTTNQRIKRFKELVMQFLPIFIKTLSAWTAKIRHGKAGEEKMGKIVNALEAQTPFVPDRLKRWLNLQRQEFKTLKSLDKLPGVLVMSSMERLEKEIRNGCNGSYAVVLHLPSPSEELNSLVNEMNRFIVEFSDVESSSWMNLTTKKSDQTKVKSSVYRQLFTSGQEFSNWKTFHNPDTKNVRYIIFYDECTDRVLPFTRLYQCGMAETLPLDFTIPKAPGQVTVTKNRRGVIKFSWRADNPCTTAFRHYLVQYRTVEGHEDHWNSVKKSSNTVEIDYLQSGETYLFRVAAETLGGRSPFSPVSSEVKVDPVSPAPTGLRAHEVTDTNISISWCHQPYSKISADEELSIASYSVECWMSDSRHDSTFIQRSTTNKSIVLEPLVPGATYSIQVRAECKNASGSTLYSPASEILEAETLREPERAAIVIRRTSKKCCTLSEIDVYELPLKKLHNIKVQGVGHYAFGEPSYLALFGKRRQRTILVLGATGSGKSTLINAMANYVLGVQWEDDFRFKLINEPADKSQAYSQTDLVTTYDFYEMKGSRLDYSLTIVDTPGFGDTRGVEKDKKIMQQLKDYFQSPRGIQQLEAVCFVVQSSLARLTPTQQYIFDQILSIFGENIKDNIRLMVTFADNSLPPVLDAVKKANIPSPTDPTTGQPLHHKFNNSIFFETNKSSRQVNEFNRTYFKLAVNGFDKFFSDLRNMEAKSLTLTREVLEERKRLEALVEGLQIRTQIKLARIDEFEQIKKILAENQQQMDENKNFDFEVEVFVPKSKDISRTGQYTTNCQKCTTTCHFPCSQASDTNKHRCSVMDPNGNCRICDCPWNVHYNQKYRYEMVKEKVQRSSDTIRKQYQEAKAEALTNQELLAKIQAEIDQYEKQLMKLVQDTSPCIQRLNEIALKPHTLSTPAYIDLMIETEKQEHRPGYQQRITTLQRLRQVSEMMTKLVNDHRIPTTQPSISQSMQTNRRDSPFFLKTFKR